MKETVLEFIKRFIKDNPRYCKVIQISSIVLLVASFLVGYLSTKGVQMPILIKEISQDAVKFFSVLVGLIAQLPNKEQ